MNATPCPHCGIAMRQLRADGRCSACGKLLPENLRAPPAIAVKPPPPPLPFSAWHNWDAAIQQCKACRDSLFPIRSQPRYGFYAGFFRDGRQVLVGCLPGGKMVMVLFDCPGNLTGVVHQELPPPEQLLEAGDLAAVYDDNYEEYLRRELQLSPGV